MSVGWSNYFVGLMERSFGMDLPEAFTKGMYAGGLINLESLLRGPRKGHESIAGQRSSGDRGGSRQGCSGGGQQGCSGHDRWRGLVGG